MEALMNHIFERIELFEAALNDPQSEKVLVSFSCLVLSFILGYSYIFIQIQKKKGNLVKVRQGNRIEWIFIHKKIK